MYCIYLRISLCVDIGILNWRLQWFKFHVLMRLILLSDKMFYMENFVESYTHIDGTSFFFSQHTSATAVKHFCRPLGELTNKYEFILFVHLNVNIWQNKIPMPVPQDVRVTSQCPVRVGRSWKTNTVCFHRVGALYRVYEIVINGLLPIASWSLMTRIADGFPDQW